MKPFLFLQLRPPAAADNEYEAFVKHGGLTSDDVKRIDLYHENIPVDLNLDDYSGILLGGGAPCVSDKVKKEDVARFEAQLTKLMKRVVDQDFPYLGLCYGLGFLNNYVGGLVCKDKDASEDVGAVDVILTEEGKQDELLKDLPETFRAFVGHKESCMEIPEGAVLLAKSERCPVHMIRVGQNVYGTQFHPELDVEGMCVRVDVYKYAGYFPPEEAEPLKERMRQENVTIPPIFLRNWVNKYKKQ